MERQYEKIFQTAMKFHKLKISSTLLPVSHSEYVTLKSIRGCASNSGNIPTNVKVSMISERMHVNTTAVSRSLKALEAKGWIERTVNVQDRRETYVTLTPQGEQQLQEWENIIWEYTDAVFAQVDEEELIRIGDFLDELYEIAKQELDKRRT